MAILLYATVLLMTSPMAQGAQKVDYYNLLSKLLTGYKKEVRPVNNSSISTEVYLTFSLLSMEVNERTQSLMSNAQLEVDWYDEYLSWAEEDHQNITTILLPQKSLWLPDIVVGNTVSSAKELGYDNLQVRLLNDGRIVWSPSGVLETSCDIDITYYPFDTQVCSVTFQTSVSLKSEIYIYIDKTNPIDISEFSQNGLWNLLESSAQNLGEEDSRTKIEFKLRIQRRRAFYVLNIILPLLFLSLTSSLTFALPADAGEKMSLSITVLLAYAVYLTLITGSMPSTSVQVSVLTIYLVILLALTAASVVLSVWILRFHHLPDNRPVRGCLASATVSIRKALRMPSADDEGEMEDSVEETSRPKPKPNSVVPFVVDTKSATLQNAELKKRQKEGKEGPRPNSWVTSSRSRAPAVVSGRVVAEMMDRLIFWIFLAINLLSTVACLLAMGIGAAKQFDSTRFSNQTDDSDFVE